MTGLNVGETVKVPYAEGISEYIFLVYVSSISQPNEFVGRVEGIFAANGPYAPGEITGGDILRWKGQERTFEIAAIIS